MREDSLGQSPDGPNTIEALQFIELKNDGLSAQFGISFRFLKLSAIVEICKQIHATYATLILQDLF